MTAPVRDVAPVPPFDTVTVPPVQEAHWSPAACDDAAVRHWPSVPTANRTLLVPLCAMRSPLVVSGESALKPRVCVICPVPPWPIVSGRVMPITFAARVIGALTEIVACFELKVVQSALVSRPRLVPDADGRLNVCAVPHDTIPMSVPVVPVANVWVAPVSALRLVIPAPSGGRYTWIENGGEIPAPDNCTT